LALEPSQAEQLVAVAAPLGLMMWKIDCAYVLGLP
jgi:hypothetical protein